MELLKGKIQFFIGKFKKKRNTIQPLSSEWKGASIVLIVTSCTLFVFQTIYLFGERGFFDFTVATLLFILAIVLIGGLLAIFLHALKKMPSRYLWSFFSSFMMLYICFIGPLTVSALFIFVFITVLTFWGAILYHLKTGNLYHANRKKRISFKVLFVTLTACIGLIGYWIIDDGHSAKHDVTLKDLKKSARYDSNLLPNPAEIGPYKVKTISYGSKNSYRKEFNQADSLITKTVDGSPFVEKWSSLRTKTVGFGPSEMPLNGMVWYPEGEGPFPLVVIVHGNHLMSDYSDPGYEYLGKLLATRGYIFVSIDENFLNVSPYDNMFFISALEKENPARSIILLEHLKTWRKWNKDSKNPFYQKVDMNQIGLIGHSRGGEAISLAAAFNKLSVYPDNANISFDYNFQIRSLISIAGTDGQYLPSGKSVSLQNLNYLALHGSHDMDVNTFDSSNQYNRIHFTNKEDFFKAYVYIYGANHGQFNQTWSRGDGVGIGNQLFNLKQLMPRKYQENLAKVFISSFLDATLKNNQNYKNIFKDIGYAKKWLPDTMYISNYNDSHTTILSSFDEDINLQSTTIKGGRIQGENLQKWKEEKIKMKYGETHYSAVRISWDRNKNAKTASYTVFLPEEGLEVNENSSIVFSMADSRNRTKLPYQKDLVDLNVIVEDRNGNQASLPLSHVSKLVPMVEGKLLKWPFLNFGPTKEPVFQNFDFSLRDFKQINPHFNSLQIRQLRFEFNRTKKGTVLINDIGIR